MKTTIVGILTLTATLIFSASVLADAEKNDWFGDWQMNHDGRVGTLRIARLQAPCANSNWCDIDLTYLDANGNRYVGSVESIDDRWQHMGFFISFPGNRQKFDAYLFSWDKLHAAGTTYWNGRTFGFSATKKQAGQQGPNAVLGRTILANGVVEIRYADGTIKRISRGGTTIVSPDGSQHTSVFLETQAPEPPLLPSDNQVLRTWREYHNESLLSLIRGLVLNDASAIDTLRNLESG